jgi:hypothetical protein
MQPYKGYFIDGSAMPVHPFNPDWYVGGSVWCRGAVVQSWKSPAFSFTSSLCDRSVAHSFGKTWLLADWVRRT